MHEPAAQREAERRALSVIVHNGDRADDLAEATAEMSELAAAANLEALAALPCRIRAPHPATHIGAGAIDKIRRLAAACQARRALFDCELSAAQARNLESELRLAVSDRSDLILSIFSRRATSSEGKLQVELAQCRRQMARLSGLWTHLERQRGGIGVRGGPGEKQMELDRRLLETKARRLERRLEGVMARGDLARKRRRKNGVLTAALVGYTNAGKSSLFNLLAGENKPANDRLFDTLDTTARRMRLDDGRRLALSDTVGFIRRLPHELIAGFRATLRDTAESDILLIVADIARPDWRERMRLTERQLRDIGAGDKRRIAVFNKIDLAGVAAQIGRYDTMPAVFLSCRAREGVALLRRLIAQQLAAAAPR